MQEYKGWAASDFLIVRLDVSRLQVGHGFCIVADMYVPLKLNLPVLVLSTMIVGGCTVTQPGSSIGTVPVPASERSDTQPIELVPEKSLDAEAVSAAPPSTATPPSTSAPETVSRVILETSKGAITIELYPKDAPNTVRNFLQKMQTGAYGSRIFHRVEDWVIQGGDPLGNGTGGGSMPTELSDRVFVEGSVGVARGGDLQVSNADQFFICTQECSWLTGQYTHFGKVIKGMDVVKKIAVGDSIFSLAPVQTPSSPTSR